MQSVRKEMEGYGYIFLGDFQEEGKKRIFVKAREGVKTWEDAMMDLTGVDFKQVQSIPDAKVRNQIVSNLQKYAKLIWWGEMNPNKDVWEAAIKNDITRELAVKKLQ